MNTSCQTSKLKPFIRNIRRVWIYQRGIQNP